MNNIDIIKDLRNIKPKFYRNFSMQLEECKLSVMAKEKVSDKILEQLHHELI